jgi:hypothetical protein
MGPLILPQPFQGLLRAFVGWEYRIKNLRDAAVVDNERQPLDQRLGIELERRKSERLDEIQFRIAQQRVGEFEPFDHFTLVLRILRA